MNTASPKPKVYRNARTLSIVVRALFGTYIAMAVTRLAVNAFGIHYIGLVQSGAPAVQATGTFIDEADAIGSLIALPLYVACGISLMMWIIRIRHNLEAIGVKGLKFNDVDAAGSFLIPIYNLFKPFQAMHETWQASSWQGDSAADWSSAPGWRLIDFWWLAWVAYSGAGAWVGLASANLKRHHELADAMGFFQSMCLFNFVAICAAAAAFLVVAKITARVEHKRAHVQTDPVA